MSQENVNVEVVLASYEWGNRERKVPAHFWHEDGEWTTAPEDPDHATYRGLDAIERLFASWIEVYEDMSIQPVETRARGNRVFVWARFSGTSAESGVPLAMEMAQVLTLEDGRIRRLQAYLDRAEALKAVGLEE